MHISDIDVPRREVAGFPQLSVIEPDLDGLAELQERFRDGGDGIGENIVWLFDRFVRDREGKRIEGVDTPAEAKAGVRQSLVVACINALGPGGEALDEAPQS